MNNKIANARIDTHKQEKNLTKKQTTLNNDKESSQ